MLVTIVIGKHYSDFELFDVMTFIFAILNYRHMFSVGNRLLLVDIKWYIWDLPHKCHLKVK